MSSLNVRITSSLNINNGNLQYQNRPSAFNGLMNGSRGPTPGTVLVSTSGTTISLSQLQKLGGYCRIQNLDPTYVMYVGTFDPTHLYFAPLMDFLPGESFVFRLSRFVGEALGTGAGTGTDIEAANLQLRAKFDTKAGLGLFECFDY